MRHKGFCASVDGSFEHHFIVRVDQLWPPEIPDLDRLDDRGQGCHESVDFNRWKPMLAAFQHLFIFQKERGACNKRESSLTKLPKNYAACASARAQPTYDDRCIEHEPHA